MIRGTHLQQHLVEGGRGFFVLRSTEETKPHYRYTQRGHIKHVFPMITRYEERREQRAMVTAQPGSEAWDSERLSMCLPGEDFPTNRAGLVHWS